MTPFLSRSAARGWILACLLGLTSHALHADVIVLDAAGGGDATSLFAAVALAADGDTILAQPGDYSLLAAPLEVGTKAFTLVAAGPGVVLPALRIRELSSSRDVVLRGLNFFTELPIVSAPSVEIIDCTGRVWIEDCTLTGSSGSIFSPAGTLGLRVENSAQVLVSRSTISGGTGAPTDPAFLVFAGDGGAGVLVINSDVQLHDSLVRGGMGGSDQLLGLGNGPKPGATGLSGSGAVLLLNGGQIIGGRGGFASTGAGGTGGNGLEFLGSPAFAQRNATLLAGGAGGISTNGTAGVDGLPSLLPNGVLVEGASVSRTLEITAPAQELGASQVVYRGEQGDIYLLFLSTSSFVLPMPARHGVWMLSPPIFTVGGLHVVNSSDGVDILPFTLGNFGDPSLESFLLFEQAFVRDTANNIHISNASSFIGLDEVF